MDNNNGNNGGNGGNGDPNNGNNGGTDNNNNGGNGGNNNNNNGGDDNNNQQSSTSLLPIPQTAAAGGITITQPTQTATSYYKIAPGELVTFAWSFTSIINSPTALTVSAVCDNGNTYPVGPSDGVIPGDATQVVWDLYAYQTNNPQKPLAQATYTLNVFDQRGIGAIRRGGIFNPNTAVQFALYSPQAYTPLADGWTCPACSGSLSSYVANPMFVSIIVTFFIMFFSGLHLLRTANRT